MTAVFNCVTAVSFTATGFAFPAALTVTTTVAGFETKLAAPSSTV